LWVCVTVGARKVCARFNGRTDRAGWFMQGTKTKATFFVCFLFVFMTSHLTVNNKSPGVLTRDLLAPSSPLTPRHA